MRRLELGKGQEDIVAATGDLMTQAWVSDVERGKVDLNNAGFGKVVALARALDWTLIDMQHATGVDLGITELTPVGAADEEMPVYLLSSIAQPTPTLHSYEGFELDADEDPAKLLIVLADNTDMERPGGRSIHPGDAVFLRTDLTQLEERQGYAIQHQGRVLLRRYEVLGGVSFFVADNPALARELIPTSDAVVLGRITRIASDYRPDQLN
jgi:hypothetical protein